MPGSERAYPLLLVAAGGFAGTLARYATSRVLDGTADWPIATLIVNIAGAFALGMLIETSSGRGMRLLVGTGFLGSFTTYSSFAVETERMIAGGDVGSAVGYAVASLIVGLVACAAGVAAASRRSRRAVGRSRA